MNVQFGIVPCESIYNGIFGRSFLENLDTMAFTIHLKMKYYNVLGKSFIVIDGLRGSRLIHETILKNHLKIIATYEKRRNKYYEAINIVDLNVCKDEVL